MAKRDVLAYFRLRPTQSGPFLLSLAPQFALAAKCDLRLHLTAEGGLAALLPRPEGRSAVTEGDLAALRARISQAYEAAGRSAAEVDNVPLSTRDIDGEPSLMAGVFGYLWATRIAREGAFDDTIRRVIVAPDAPILGPLVRRARDARVLTGETRTLVELDDDAARGSGLSGLRASGAVARDALLWRTERAGLPIWLPEGWALAEGPEAAGLLNGLCDAGLLSRQAEVHLLPPDAEGGVEVVLAEAPVAGPAVVDRLVPAERLADTSPPPETAEEAGPALRVAVVPLAPSDAAMLALTERLTARSFPLGYRISLAAVPDRERGMDDIERLRAEIEEREAEISLLQSLARPQLRLLRFTDAQLPALVDGLRKMPAALREDRGLLYASSHGSDRPEPAHFVLYDPDRVQLDGRFPEFYWRAVSDDRPIAYWLDPHAEEARDGMPDEPAVFVPAGHRILPQIDSFGGSLSGTLRLVMGGLFADGAAVLGKAGARPAFVFTALPDAEVTGDEIGVEVIDLAGFAPLQTRLRWINEHLLLSSPVAGDPEARRELAETIYAGRLAQDLKRQMSEEVATLRSEWEQAFAEIVQEFEALNDAARTELRQTTRRIEAAQMAVDLAATRVAELDSAVAPLLAEVSGLDRELAVLEGAATGLSRQRVDFLRQYQAEVEANEALMQEADRRITALAARMDALRERLWR